MVSAVMVQRAIIFCRARLARIVRRLGLFGPRPLGEDGEEASDVLDHLPRVLAAKIAIKMRLPRLDGAVDKVVVCWFR